MALRLRIPRQADQRDPALEIRPPYLEEWVEGLPYANTLQVTRQLFDQVRALNRAPLKPSLRAELLETLTPAVRYLHDSQMRQAESSSLAVFEKNRADTDGARQVAAHLAFGYKLVLVQVVTEGSLFSRKRLERLGAQRACQYLGLLMANAYHEYIPHIPHVWQELVELYSFARKKRFEDAPSTGLTPGDLFCDSVANAFKRTALMALIDPLKLGVDELWRVHDWLGTAANAISLQPCAGTGADPAMVYLDGVSDDGPRRAGQSELTLSDQSWLFNPDPAADELAALGASAGDRGWQQLAERCSQLMVHRRERGARRISSDGLIDVAGGLSAVCHFTGGPAPTSAAQSAFAQPAQAPAGNAADGVIDIGDVPEEPLPPATPKASYHHHPWQVLNRGAGGFSLKRPEGLKFALLVGDLLGMRSQPGGPWNIGVVRWLAITDKEDFRIGVELLADRGRAVEVWRQDAAGTGSRTTSIQALLLPGRTDPGSMSIAVPAGTAPEDEVVIAKGAAGQHRLRITKLIESVGSIQLYACEAV